MSITIETILDQPMVFGRRLPLWDAGAYQIEPIGRMTLRNGGVIEGYTHSNEARWEPCKGGFAFLTDWPRPRISSNWLAQDEGGIVIGRQNGLGTSTGLCLVPAIPVSPSARVKVLVASCFHFYKRTLPRLLPQLMAAGFRRDEVKVVINEAPTRRVVNNLFEGIECLFTRHAFYEFSAYHEASTWDFDLALVMADTASVEESCRSKLYALNHACTWDGWSGQSDGGFGIGVISQEFALRLRPILEDLDGLDKMENIRFEAMGGVWQYARRVFSCQHRMVRGGDVVLGEVTRQTFRCEALGVSRHMNWDSVYRGDHRLL
ncbi:MAG: hypothetical protein KDN05_04130 [Verrucomicrobiae bacterium]|nr:hypothetical protein [Verrucomicrobiae bacterium]